MLAQLVGIEFQHRLNEHAQCQVDQLQFLFREPGFHVHREDFVRQLHVVDAVRSVPCQLRIVEVRVAFADGVQHFLTLDPDPHAFGLRLEAVCLVVRVKGTRHAQCISPHLRVHPVVPVENGAIEGRVLAHHHRIRPVEGLDECLALKLRHPLGGAVIDLDGKTNQLELRRTHVVLGRDLAQAVLAVVVCLRIECDDFHQKLYLSFAL